jgi:hypothetical protein
MMRRALPGVPGFMSVQRLLEWAAIVAGLVVMRVIARPSSWLGWFFLVLAALLVAAPVIMAAFREHAREQQAVTAVDLATQYRTRLTVTLVDALTPLADLVGRINLAEGEQRVALQAQLRQGVVGAAAALCGGDRTRAAFFVLNDSELRPEAWSGRAEAPPVGVVAASERTAKFLVSLVHEHGRLLVPDLSDRRAPIRAGPHETARTLMVAAVYAGKMEFGVLVADNPEPDSLEAPGLDILGTLAQLLGAGLAAAAHHPHNGHAAASSG